MVSVIINLDSGKYQNQVPFLIEKTPVNEEKMTVKQAREHQEEQKRLLREQHQKYHLEDHRLIQLFQADLEQEFDIVGHPKAEKLFKLAWEHGHSSGYRKVYYYYSDMVELFK